MVKFFEEEKADGFEFETWNAAGKKDLHPAQISAFVESARRRIGIFQEFSVDLSYEIQDMYPRNCLYISKTSVKRIHGDFCCNRKKMGSCMRYRKETEIDDNGLMIVWSKHFEFVTEIIPEYIDRAKEEEFGRRTSNWLKLRLNTQVIYVMNVHLQVPKVVGKEPKMHPKSVKVMNLLNQEIKEITKWNPDAIVVLGGDFNVQPSNLEDLGLSSMWYFTKEFTNICPVVGELRLDYNFIYGAVDSVDEYVVPPEPMYDHRQVRATVKLCRE